MFEAVTGEVVDPKVAARFYPGVSAGTGAMVRAWPAPEAAGTAEAARGWWRPTTQVLREERRKAASRVRTRATRRLASPVP